VLDAASGRMFAYLETALNVVHVDDVGRGHVLAYERGQVGRRYVLGGEDLALAELFASVTGLVGRKPPRLRLAPGTLLPYAAVAEMWARATGGVPRVTRDELVMARRPMRFSSARAERELGYAHRPAAAALADAVGWFVEKGRVRLPAGGAPLLAPRRAASPRR